MNMGWRQQGAIAAIGCYRYGSPELTAPRGLNSQTVASAQNAKGA